MFQQKNPVEREKSEFVKPFSNMAEPTKQDLDRSISPEQPGNQVKSNPAKISSMTLATTKYDVKAKIVKHIIT